jgi:2-succinyl-5-enolpyruvyl-6-hydroxy-3-cyclohexene-1-carboxylate synthase
VARIDNLLVVGHPTLSRSVSKLLARADLPITVVSERETFTDVADVATHLRTLPAENTPGVGGWLTAWQSVDRVVGGRLDALLGDAFSGWSVAAAVASDAEQYAALVIGSSSPVRDLDLAPVPTAWPAVFANRGLAGIDGTVSTAAGVSLELGPTIALMGDLTFLHDTNGMMIGPGEARPPLRIVVVNDDGGSIFATLEPGAPEHGTHFERVFGTPHRTDLAALCAAHGVRYKRADSYAELQARLHDPALTLEVLEAPITRAGRREVDQRIARLADF